MDRIEEAGYLEVSGAHLYTVLHRVADPLVRVLLVGPFAAERSSSYIPWVRWARFLAARQMEVLRYDYRGMGESTGVFENMSFDEWTDDVEFLSDWLKSRAPDVPLVLHGLELGGLLAGKVFAGGIGDALLAWGAPAHANEVLRAALLRRIAMDNMFKYGAERRPVAEYIRQLETGPMEVDGYQWPSRLWRESFQVTMPFAANVENASQAAGRPVMVAPLDKNAAPLVKGSTYELMNPDLTGLFAEHCEWIAGVPAASLARA